MGALTEQQRQVFGDIAVGLDEGHPPEVLLRLTELGLIQGHQPDGGPARWGVPVHLHIQWAQWCSEQVAEDA